MINLRRNKRPLYVCAIDKNTSTYSTPIERFDNYQVTKSQSDLTTFGLDAYKYVRIKTNSSAQDFYHVGDRVYINVEPPTTSDAICKTADYEVVSPPVVTLNECEVLLKQRSGR